MGKKIVYGAEAREALKRGIDKNANAVKVTLGPKGRNVVIAHKNFQGGTYVQSTKDGVTVSKSIVLSDNLENAGNVAIQQVANQTAKEAGDGTTTSCVLAQYIITEGLKAVTDGANPVELKKGMEIACEHVVSRLKELSIPVTDKMLTQVATIAANNDEELGKIIGEMFNKIGKDGIVSVETSKVPETYVEFIDGYVIDKGMVHPLFSTDAKRMVAEYNNPLICIAPDAHLTYFKELLPLLTQLYNPSEFNPEPNHEQALILIVHDIDGEALGTLIQNRKEGDMPIVVLRAPSVGDYRKEICFDIATVTGATVLCDETGHYIDKVQVHSWCQNNNNEPDRAEIIHLGRCEKIIISATSCVILNGAGSKKAIEERTEGIKTQIAEYKDVEQQNGQDDYGREVLRIRLSKITGAAAKLFVFGKTDVEIGERKDRIDDAIRATKCAMMEGVVPGGGIALIRCEPTDESRKIPDSPTVIKGYDIIIDALFEPLRQIVENSGLSYIDIANVLNTNSVVLNHEDIPKGHTATELLEIYHRTGKIGITIETPFLWFWKKLSIYHVPFRTLKPKPVNFGFNAKTNMFEDLVLSGVIDPTKVVRTALENAISVASLVLITEVLNVEE